jgi:hypothetical protein
VTRAQRALCGLAVLLFGVQVAALPPAGAAEYHRYRGCVHVHTRYSDGGGDFAAIAAAAEAVGLDYLIATDHNTLQPLKDGHERYWGKRLVLVGAEISTDAGHVLGLDLPASFEAGTRVPQAAIDRVNAAGGFALLAHPLSDRWAWQDWRVRGVAGMEIVNLSSLFDDDLMDAQHGVRIHGRSLVRLLDTLQLYDEDPDSVMARVSDNLVPRERAKWDELLKIGRQVVGTGAVDAHARLPLGRKVYAIPSYAEAFETVQSCVLTLAPLRGEVAHDRDQIYRAYRNGRLYILFARIAAAPEFSFTAREEDREATMGQPIRRERAVRLAVRAPDHPHPVIRLVHNGSEVGRAEGESLEFTATQPGAYRVEVYAAEGSSPLLGAGQPAQTVDDLLRAEPRRIKPWIFSNPIYVR